MESEKDKKEINVKIFGMTCASCVSTIEKSAKNVDGVQKIEVNLGDGTAKVEYMPSKFKFQGFKKVIEELGYS
ncbi:MAG: heavy-metal-associated domain-containing protein, partial [Promethearchaeota archaeon]